jgi:hypothetical protein
MNPSLCVFNLHVVALHGTALAADDTTFVVLPSDATVHTRPDTQSPTVSLTDSQPRADFTLLELAGQHSDWLELQTTAKSHGHMERADHLKPYVVQLFHHSQTAHPVLNTLARFTDTDGLEQLVLPGQPLQPNEDGNHRFAAGRLESLGTVSPKQVSQSFQMTTIGDWLPNEERWLCTLDDGLLEAHQTCTEPNALGAAQNATEPVYRVRTDDHGTIALVKRNHWHYSERRVKAVSAHGEPRTDTTFGPVMGVIGGPIQSGKIVRLTKGSDVFWMNGTVAGQVRYDHSLAGAQLKDHGALRCTGLPWQASDALGGLGQKPTQSPKALGDYPIQLCVQSE